MLLKDSIALTSLKKSKSNSTGGRLVRCEATFSLLAVANHVTFFINFYCHPKIAKSFFEYSNSNDNVQT